VLTDREQMIDAVWMKGVCKALVAGATPPAPAQDFITALAPAARDTLDKFEGGDKSAFAAFTTLYPTIASFPQLTPVALGTPLPAEVLAVVNTPEREDFEREEYELVDLSATNDAPATRWVISPGQSVYYASKVHGYMNDPNVAFVVRLTPGRFGAEYVKDLDVLRNGDWNSNPLENELKTESKIYMDSANKFGAEGTGGESGKACSKTSSGTPLSPKKRVEKPSLESPRCGPGRLCQSHLLSIFIALLAVVSAWAAAAQPHSSSRPCCLPHVL